MPGSEDAAVAGEPRVASIVVAQVFHDFPSLPTKEWSKVEVFFEAPDDRISAGDVNEVSVDGPDGWHYEIPNTPFRIPFVSGYVDSQQEDFFWYQAILPGFLKDGVYTVSVEFEDGRVSTLSRELRTRFELLDFYKAHVDEMRYAPTGVSPANDTTLQWSTLAELGGPDAYYNVWISPGMTEAIDATTARGDHIFLDALTEPDAGLNADHSRMGTKAAPLRRGAQTWQPEILDSNVLQEVNMIIFPAGRHFVAD